MTCRAACIQGAPPAQTPSLAAAGGGPLVVCVHGILTNTTSRSWCDRFEVWAWEQDPAVKVIKREYWGGPVPAVNVWIRNPIQARALAEEILAFAKSGACPISIIAHSNGCDIAIKTAHRLSALGVRLRSLVLIGGACESDASSSGIWHMCDAGGIGEAWAYCSEDDAAVRSKWIWPYGRLGATGWRLDGCSFSDGRIKTRWFPGYAHNDYFADGIREKTFDRAWRDCGLSYHFPLHGGAR